MLDTPISPEDQISAIFSNAQTQVSPLDGLFERVMKDPGAHLQPDVIEAMKGLKKSNPAHFESFRTALKKLGCRVGELDKLIDGSSEKEFSGRPNQADILVEIGREDHLFHDKAGNAYADIYVNGHRETWSISSKHYSDHLTRRYYRQIGRPPANDAIKTAIQTLVSLAKIEGPEELVFKRVAQHDGKIYTDPCNDNWSCTEISSAGFCEIEQPPIRFVRSKGMRVLIFTQN